MDGDLIKSILAIGRQYSTDLSIYDEDFLVKSLRRKPGASYGESAEEYCELLRQDRAEAEAYLGSLQVVFSQFFREPLSFALLEQVILPNILKDAPPGSEIRVWSAGCACGEEAYSLAMLIEDQLQWAQKDLRYRIFATDVSQAALGAAQEGVYDAPCMQNVKYKYLNRFFTSMGKRFAISPQLKKHVSFSKYNLLDTAFANPPESIFGNFNIICCCNLLVYYRQDARLFMLNKIENALQADGYLIVGDAERAFVKQNTGLHTVPATAPVFQKPS